MPRTVIDADGYVGKPKEHFERYLAVPLDGHRLHNRKVSGGRADPHCTCHASRRGDPTYSAYSVVDLAVIRALAEAGTLLD